MVAAAQATTPGRHLSTAVAMRMVLDRIRTLAVAVTLAAVIRASDPGLHVCFLRTLLMPCDDRTGKVHMSMVTKTRARLRCAGQVATGFAT